MTEPNDRDDDALAPDTEVTEGRPSPTRWDDQTPAAGPWARWVGADPSRSTPPPLPTDRPSSDFETTLPGDIDPRRRRRAPPPLPPSAQPPPPPEPPPSPPQATHPATSYAGRYTILGLLGVGGMGSVYRALDTNLDEEVALKILRRDLGQTADAVARFRREVKLARRVTHRNVARVFDVGEVSGEHFFTMECLEGEPLATLLAPGKPFSIARTLDLGRQMTAGLAAAHAAGVLHRDLKPENILFTKEGRIVLTDFGVAVARSEVEPLGIPVRAAGTPLYMAPEQIEGRELDERTDLYALGLVLFEMATGSLPWGREGEPSVQLARLAVPAPDARERNPRVTEGLARLLSALLHREPSERPSSADAVLAEIDDIASGSAGEPMSAMPPPVPQAERSPITTTGAPHALAIAVLPVQNLGRPEDAYLSETVTDALIDRLATTPGLRVASRSALRLRDHAGEDIGTLGRALGVDVVVEASLAPRGGHLRLHARVVEVERGFVLWTGRFDRATPQVFDLVPEVAESIAAALAIDLGGMRTRGPHDPGQVDVFARARQAYATCTLGGAETAAELLGSALAAGGADDPLLLASLALAELRLHSLDPSKGVTVGARAEDRARRALLLEPPLGEAHLALGVHAWLTGDAPLAARRFEEATRCNPALAEVHELLGRLRCETGDVVQGVRDLDIALRLDQRQLGALWHGARALELAGDTVGADQRLRQAEAIAPHHAVTLTLQARFALFRQDERALVGLREAATHAVASSAIEAALLRLFVEPHPEEVLGQLTAHVAQRGACSLQRSTVLALVAEQRAGVGAVDEALSALRGATPGSVDALWFDKCPALSSLRGTPAFSTLASRVREQAALVFPRGRSRGRSNP